MEMEYLPGALAIKSRLGCFTQSPVGIIKLIGTMYMTVTTPKQEVTIYDI